MSVVFRAFVFLACFLLAACGGGGGGGSSEAGVTEPETAVPEVVGSESLTSKADADRYYLKVSDSSYTGSSQVASLDEANLLTFAAYVLGQDSTPENFRAMGSDLTENAAVQRINMSVIASIEVLRSGKNLYSTEVKTTYESSDMQASDVESSENQIVNETIACAEGGTVSYDGVLDSIGQGLLKVRFDSCISVGVTLSGNGHMAYEFSNGESRTIYYDSVNVFDSSGGVFLDGYISSISGNDVSSSSTTSYLTVTDNKTGDQLKFNDFVKAYYFGQQISFEGEIYLSGLGYVSVRTAENLGSNGLDIYSGKILFVGETAIGGIDFHPEGNAAVLLDGDGDGVFETGAALSDIRNLNLDNHSNIQFIPVSDINFPPTVYAPYIYSGGTYDTRSPLYADTPYYNDPEGDSVTVLEHRWYRNGELVMTTVTNEFPPYTAFYGDTVGVRVLVSDGKHEVLSEEGTFVMRDAPGDIQVSDVPAKATPGEMVSFTAQIVDPDLQNTPAAAVLELAPEGMIIDSIGNVTWIPPSPSFAGISTYRFNVKSPTDDYVFQSFSITVVDDSVSLPIARSGIEVPKYNHSTHIGDFDGDSQNEVLTTDSIQRVMLLEKVDDVYKQVWMYPFTLPTSGTIVQLLGYDLEGDEALEMIVATQKGISYIGTDSKYANTILTYENEFIQAFAMENIDGVGGPELAILVADSSYHGSSRYLDIVDFNTKERLKRISVGSEAREVVIGNVDSDAQLEVITNDGLVYDGSSLNNEWFYGDGFGDLVSVGDVDNNGVDEIFGAETWGDIALFNAQTKSKLWTQENGNTCSILVANADLDPQEEVIVGDCQWGNITAYEAISGSPIQDYQWNMVSHGSKSLAAGDSDNDGAIEIHWGTGQSHSGENQFVVAEYSDSSVITNDNPAQLDKFTAAGWGEVDSIEKAVFIIPSTDNGYEGQRVALMDFNGDYSLSDQISNNWGGGNFGVAVDYDNNGGSELFLATADIYDGSFVALNLADFSSIWTSGAGDHDDNISIVKAADINKDGNQDAVYVNNKSVEVIDIKNQVRLASTLSTTEAIQDIAIGDIDDDGDLDIMLATFSRVQVWSQVDGDFEKLHEASVGCHQIELIEIDVDRFSELVCLGGDYYYQDSSTLTKYDVSDQGFTVMDSYDIGYPVTEMAVDPVDQSTLYVAIKLEGEDYGNEYGSLQQVSMLSGAVLWSGPDLLGTVSKGSLFIRTEAQANGGARMMFGTNRAMYLIP